MISTLLHRAYTGPSRAVGLVGPGHYQYFYEDNHYSLTYYVYLLRHRCEKPHEVLNRE